MMTSPAAAGLASEWELAILSAGTEARRAKRRERATRLAERADWGKLAALLTGGRVLPSLGPRIVELSDGTVDERFREALAAALEAQRRQDALLSLVGERVGLALAAAGIRSSPLKGPQLGEAIYGEPGRRPSSDIDLLLAAEDLPAATRVVATLGYSTPRDVLDADGLALLHLTMSHCRGELPPIELHWRIHWYETRFARERLLPPLDADQASWRPAREDELAALLLYYARDGFTGLRQAGDLGAWWDRFGNTVPGDYLARIAATYPKLAPALCAAAVVAERTVGVAGNDDAARLLDRRGRIAVELGTRLQLFGSQEQLFAEIGLIDGLLTPRGGRRAFLRRQIIPSPEVIAEHAEKANHGRTASTIGFATRTLARFGISLSRLLRRGSSA